MLSLTHHFRLHDPSFVSADLRTLRCVVCDCVPLDLEEVSPLCSLHTIEYVRYMSGTGVCLFGPHPTIIRGLTQFIPITRRRFCAEKNTAHAWTDGPPPAPPSRSHSAHCATVKVVGGGPSVHACAVTGVFFRIRFRANRVSWD